MLSDQQNSVHKANPNRNYGIDLMKGLAMMMVVAHHVIMALPNDGLCGSVAGNMLVQAFHVFCYCAVDCFVMATGFIMCAKDWRVGRIVRLWSQVVGYSVALALIAVLFFPSTHVGMREWMQAFMPLTFDRYWFVTQYVALFFTLPYLNKMIAALSIREHARLLITGLCLLSISTIWAGRDLFAVKWGYTFIWFIYLYLAGAFFPRIAQMGKMPGKCIGLSLIVLGVLLSVGSDALGRCLGRHFGFGARFSELLWSYASPTVLMESVGMMIVFSGLDVKWQRMKTLISLCCASTFIVYVVHSNEIFKSMIGWKTVFLSLQDYGFAGIIFGSAFFAMSLYLAIVAVDVARKQVVRLILRGYRHTAP